MGSGRATRELVHVLLHAADLLQLGGGGVDGFGHGEMVGARTACTHSRLVSRLVVCGAAANIHGLLARSGLARGRRALERASSADLCGTSELAVGPFVATWVGRVLLPPRGFHTDGQHRVWVVGVGAVEFRAVQPPPGRERSLRVTPLLLVRDRGRCSHLGYLPASHFAGPLAHSGHRPQRQPQCVYFARIVPCSGCECGNVVVGVTQGVPVSVASAAPGSIANCSWAQPLTSGAQVEAGPCHLLAAAASGHLLRTRAPAGARIGRAAAPRATSWAKWGLLPDCVPCHSVAVPPPP
mmetsp:Transcript_71549/g.165454  ORF Transcript_71549/g.165454 Transcript_71549/m.165454 type:complete len:296 (-) Transcript_71549:473-1360(-)